MTLSKHSYIGFLFIFLLSSCCFFQSQKICITDAKIAAGVDEKLMPVNITDVFPKDTSKVSCWFQWKKAKIGTPIVAKWHYVTDDIHVFDYTFKIPRKEGKGSIALAMPENKMLPPGEYKIDLTVDDHILKSLHFRIEE
ncbi:MAG: hypothetical protein ABIC68_06570 [Candidatus Omnitrophota bacterium]